MVIFLERARHVEILSALLSLLYGLPAQFWTQPLVRITSKVIWLIINDLGPSNAKEREKEHMAISSPVNKQGCDYWKLLQVAHSEMLSWSYCFKCRCSRMFPNQVKLWFPASVYTLLPLQAQLLERISPSGRKGHSTISTVLLFSY